MTMKKRMILRLVWLAYDLGWRNACNDHLGQRADPEHAIGESKQPTVTGVLLALDPQNVLGLRE